MKALSRNLQKEVLDCIQISCYEIVLQDDCTILGKDKNNAKNCILRIELHFG